MTRLQAFESLFTHPWHRKTLSKLNPTEVAWCRTFIADNDKLDVAAFRAKVHFLGLDRADKTKTEVVELLGAANSLSQPEVA